MLTCLTWLWIQPGGRTEYTAQHVAIWASMIRRNLKRKHRIACVTHEDIDVPGVEIIRPPREFENVRIPTWKEHRPQCLRRLTMFRPDAARIFGEKIVCMDLDICITGPLDPFFAGDPEFRIATGAPIGMPYNGSVIFLTAGARPQVYERFTPQGAAEAGRRFIGSDQAWISHVLGPNEPTWTEADGLTRWQPGCKPSPLMIFPGGVKPWEAIQHDAAVARHYRREGRRKVLILGRGPRVWHEAEAALDEQDFDGVIALRGPSRHWPGPLDAIANDESHARKLARMLGYSSVTLCGQVADG